MTRYLLDTKIERVGLSNCFISELTIAEMLYGIANGAPDRQASNRQRLDRFLLLFPHPRRLALTAVLETYAAQKAHLKRLGRLQGEFDMLIGSTALAHGLTLATRNTRHFADIFGLALENWIDNS